MNASQPPMWIDAPSPEDLRLKMVALNIRHSKKFHFFDIQNVKGVWFAWYELSESDRLQKELNNADK